MATADEKNLMSNAHHASKRDLEWERDFMSAVLDTVDALVVVLDRTGRIVRFNRSCEKATGYRFDEVRGKFVWDMLIPPEQVEGVKKVFDDLKAGQFPSRYENYWIAKDGSRILILWSNTAMLDAEGEVEYVVPTGIDITEHRRTEQEKETLRSELARSQKLESIGRLAGGIAHDFNNLLSAIIGYSEILMDSLPAEGPLSPAVRTIRLAGEKAAALTRQLLAFSRNQVLEMKPLNLNRVIDDMFKMLRRMIGEDVILSLRTERQVRSIVADRAQIEQILLNLAVNARDAMPCGGKLTIETADAEIGAEQEQKVQGLIPGRYVVLTVSDTGEGMSQDVVERIFEPYYTTKVQGSGLGLSTVYGIVKQHEGVVAVSSEKSKGTVFTIYFPAYEGRAEEEPQEESTAVRGGSETILVVDDEASLRELAVDALEPLGYRILTASCGEEAIQMCRTAKEKIDLLLTDMVMPGMNGRDLAETLTLRDPSMAVLFMSGYADNLLSPNERGGDTGSFIQKPLTLRRLSTKVREILDRRRRHGG